MRSGTPVIFPFAEYAVAFTEVVIPLRIEESKPVFFAAAREAAYSAFLPLYIKRMSGFLEAFIADFKSSVSFRMTISYGRDFLFWRVCVF